MHWHLIRSEWKLGDNRRFQAGDAERAAQPHGIARTPKEVADWVMQDVDRTDTFSYELRYAERLKSAEHGRDAFGTMRNGHGYVVHFSAYAAPACREH